MLNFFSASKLHQSFAGKIEEVHNSLENCGTDTKMPTNTFIFSINKEKVTSILLVSA